MPISDNRQGAAGGINTINGQTPDGSGNITVTPATIPGFDAAVESTIDTELAAITTLTNDQQLYVDALAGDDTNSGAVTAPFETLEAALALCTDDAKKYFITLAPGNYGTGPLTIPSNVSLFGKNSNIGVAVTIDFLAGIESTPIYDGVNLSDVTMDMSTSDIAIATFRNGGFGITRTDATPGPYYFRVENSNINSLDLTGTCLVSGCNFVGTCEIQPGGQLLCTGAIVGINVDMLGTAILSLIGSVFVGSVTGTDDSGNTPTVLADATSVGYGGTVTGANLNTLDYSQHIGHTPSGGMTSTNVRDAIDEVWGTSGASEVTHKYTLQAADITAEGITLPSVPAVDADVRMFVINGIEQDNGTDFTVTGTALSWSGLGYAALAEENDEIIVEYQT